MRTMFTSRIVQIIAALGAVTTLSAVLLGTSASAEPIASTLKVSPLRSDIEVEPGQSKLVQITVTNVTTEPVTVRPIKNDFTSGDDTGRPNLILDENVTAANHSLKQFMSPLELVEIPAQDSRTIDVIISVPANAKAGGYFGAVRLVLDGRSGASQVSLSSSIASLILLSVPGDVTEKVQVEDFSVQQESQFGGQFFWQPDNLKLSLKLQNKGNIQAGPFGKISVKKGDTVVYETDFNQQDPRDVILPDGTRKWQIPLKSIGEFGRYTVSATLTYGTKNQSLNIEQSFWVVPPKFAIAAASVIAGLIVLLILLAISKSIRRKRRKRIRLGRR